MAGGGGLNRPRPGPRPPPPPSTPPGGARPPPAFFGPGGLVGTKAPAPALSGISQGANNSVTLTGTSEAYSWITVYDGTSGMPLGTATTAANGTWTFQKTGTTATDFTVTATDLAGNTTQLSNLQAGTAPVTADVPVTNEALLASPHGGALIGGQDAFVFNLPPNSASTTDLTHGQDSLHISPALQTVAAAGVSNSSSLGNFIADHANPAGGTSFLDHIGGAGADAVPSVNPQGGIWLHPSDFHLV